MHSGPLDAGIDPMAVFSSENGAPSGKTSPADAEFAACPIRFITILFDFGLNESYI